MTDYNTFDSIARSHFSLVLFIEEIGYVHLFLRNLLNEIKQNTTIVDSKTFDETKSLISLIDETIAMIEDDKKT